MKQTDLQIILQKGFIMCHEAVDFLLNCTKMCKCYFPANDKERLHRAVWTV